MMDGPIKLDFSEKYDDQHAQRYLQKHQDGLGRKLSHWRDVQLARKALKLVGEPGLVLDLPCGAGRFWPMLAEKANRAIIGADNSESMLKIATQAQPADVVKRVQPLHTSAFDIALPDNAVDSIFCMRLLHHIGEAEHRLAILREFDMESVPSEMRRRHFCGRLDRHCVFFYKTSIFLEKFLGLYLRISFLKSPLAHRPGLRLGSVAYR